MCFISTWVWEASEYFSEYISYQPGYIELKGFIEYLDIPGNYEEKYPLMPILNLILLKGDDNETYSSEELSYLDYVFFIETISVQYNEDEIMVFEIKLKEINDETKDLVSCALIKIVNKGFNTKNFFVFKCCEKISLGSRYYYGIKSYDNFCLSKWYSKDDDLVELLDISLSYYNSENLQQIITSLSDQIMAHSHLFRDEDYYNDYKYVRYYDTEQAITFMNKSYTIRYGGNMFEKITPMFDYRHISDELKCITSNELTSYDYLELAQNIEENSINSQYSVLLKQTEDDFVEGVVLEEFEITAFNDAVSLLNHLNERE